MPLYTYQCDLCQAVFDVRATIQEKERGLEPECPTCHAKKTHQMITAGLVLHGSSSSKFSKSGCGPDSGPGCCG